MTKELLVNDIVTLTAAALGLVVNSATLVALLLNRHQLSTKAYLVISLSLGGIVTVAGSVLHTLFNEYAVSGIDCLSKTQVLMRDVKYVGIILTLLGLNALCFDLYVAVMHSIRYRVVCSKRRVRALICIKWFVGILLGSASSISHLIIGIGQKQKPQCKSTPKNFQTIQGNFTLFKQILTVFNQSKTNDNFLLNASLFVPFRLPLYPTLPPLPTRQPTRQPPPTQPPPPLKSKDFLLSRFYISDCILVAVLALSVLFITISLSKIYRKLKRRTRRNGNLTCEHSSACTSGSNSDRGSGIRRHCSISGSRAKKRGAVTILLLFVGFNATVLPYMIGEFYSIVVTIQARTNSTDSTQSDLEFIMYFMPYLAALALGYTVLNPVVLSLRMREVQAGYAIMRQKLSQNNQEQQRQQQQQQRLQQQCQLRHRQLHQHRSVTDAACESMLDNTDSIYAVATDSPLHYRSRQLLQQHRRRQDCCGSRSSNNSNSMVSFNFGCNPNEQSTGEPEQNAEQETEA